MGENPGLLVALMAIPAVSDEEFNDWYNTEHVPERMSVPGFLAARRFKGLDAEIPYLCLYDLESTAVLKTESYFQSSARPLLGRGSPWSARLGRVGMNVTRRVYEQTSDAYSPLPNGHSRALWFESFDVPPDGQADFEQWQQDVYLPRVTELPSILRVRTFTVVENGPHHLTLADVIMSDVFAGEAFVDLQLDMATARLRFGLTNQGLNTYRTIFEYPEAWAPRERTVGKSAE